MSKPLSQGAGYGHLQTTPHFDESDLATLELAHEGHPEGAVVIKLIEEVRFYQASLYAAADRIGEDLG